ncbi:hypothetical protein ACFL01_02230 [Planctomycetota bacterium]
MEDHPLLSERIAAEITLETGVEYAARHPEKAIIYFAELLSEYVRRCGRFNAKMRLALARNLLECIVKSEEDLEEGVDTSMLRRVGSRSLDSCLSLTTRYPEEGMKLLGVVMYGELRKQGYERREVVTFVSHFLAQTLRELKKENGNTS